ncbi:hypothetical protein [Moorena producens]|nr:hypothetical protein [Moorena producens]
MAQRLPERCTDELAHNRTEEPATTLGWPREKEATSNVYLPMS